MKSFLISLFFVLATLSISEAATIELRWQDNSTDETGFKIEQRGRQDPVTAYKEIGQVASNVTTFDVTVPTNVQYCFRVRGFNPSAQSEFSNEACMMVTPSGLVIVFKNP